MKGIILVTGATGNLGKATINALLNKGVHANNIIALVRDETKAATLKEKGITLKVGDYDNYPSLVEAFKGVEKLVLVSARDLVNRTVQHNNVVKAAKEAGVSHLLYTSFFDGNAIKNSPFDFVSSTVKQTNQVIKESGIPYTIFQDNLYMELLPMLFGEKVIEAGIYLPAGEGKASYVSRIDIADALANVLLQDGHVNKEYNISNAENVSMPDIASLLSSLAGKEISYVSPSPAEYMTTMEKFGVPAQFIKIFAGISEAIKIGEFQSAATDLESLLGRKPLTVKDFIKQTYFQQPSNN